MNNSLVKYKDLALKVIYYTKKRQLGSKIFFATSKFQDVLAYFERNIKDSQTFLKSCYFLNGKQIYPSDILLYYCTVDPSLRLVEEDMFLEIEELEHLDDASEPIYEKLLKPIINPFKLIMLNIKEGILQQVDFPKEKIEELGLDSINNNFACCNSTDSLYISCGKNFWIISYNNFKIERKEMPFFKEKHSMAYILSNNTVFIAGGTEESFYYDINSKEFITWGKMSGVQEQPALIQYGDFLYSFNSFNNSGIYFEKTKLTNPAKKWEKLVPQSGDQESGFFYNKLFGVSKCSGGNILFAGGINNQLRTFLYNLKLNVLYINPSKDESVLLSERNFYKIDHNFNIAIPDNIEKDHIIAIVNKNSKSLNLVQFEQIGAKSRNNLLRFDNPRNRLPGNVIIQCRYMAMKDYENFLKQKEMQKNNKTKGGFDVYNRKEQGKKLGDKLNGDPYRYQYRGKTPLALERISEGKSDEEDEDDVIRNKSSSAKKEKRTLDLGLKLENIGKFNFATQKRDEDKKSENKNKNKKDNEKEKEKGKENNEQNNKDNDNKIKENKDINDNKENININNNINNIKENKNLESNINNEDKINTNIEKKEKEKEKENNNNLDIESEEMSNIKNSKNSTYTEMKQSINEDINNSNNKNSIIKEKKINEKENEIIKEKNITPDKKIMEKEEIIMEKSKAEENPNKSMNPDIEKVRVSNKQKKMAREVKHKKLNIEKSGDGGKSFDGSDTPHSSVTTDTNQITKSYNPTIKYQTNNTNINSNNKINNINNINKNLNANFNNINVKENEENRNMNNINVSNIKNNSKGNIHQKNNFVQNKIKKNTSPTNNKINNNVVINNQANIIINNNLNEHEQKKIKMSKNNNINIIQNQKDNNNNVIIHKSNTAYMHNKNYQTYTGNNNNNNNLNNAFNLSSNPFIDNSKYQNIAEKESYHLKEESEPNANKILTNKNAKSIKELKIPQKKTNYKTNTVTSLQTNPQSLLSETSLNNSNNNNIISNQNIVSNATILASQNQNQSQNVNNNFNNKNNSANNFKSSSYKASTHKQIKAKKIKPVNANNNNNNNNNNMNVVNKSNISPEQKNRLVNQKMNEAKKNQNYVEMYMKYSKVQNFQTQRLNTSGNINNNYHYNNPLNSNSVRLMKSEMYTNTQHNLSNDKIIRGNNIPNISNNIKNNSNVIITKDGKRYVLAKNVQRIKREDDDNKIRNVINTDTNKININININESLNK